ncbi:hypothetical protein RUM44_011907 [Polyplax serrata]|uniref:Uncharacterized protein n=1 Tax=Polyplax serrata TaxID=468196 RepID=A0ABR1BDP1_POLSC
MLKKRKTRWRDENRLRVGGKAQRTGLKLKFSNAAQLLSQVEHSEPPPTYWSSLFVVLLQEKVSFPGFQNTMRTTNHTKHGSSRRAFVENKSTDVRNKAAMA